MRMSEWMCSRAVDGWVCGERDVSSGRGVVRLWSRVVGCHGDWWRGGM